MACREKKMKTWPVTLIPTTAGGFLIRWYAGRDDVLKALRGRADDDVIYIDVDGPCGFRIEVSFHESPVAARRARNKDVADGVLAAEPAKGRA